MADLPKFDQLPIIEKTGERHSWGLWGKDDQLGMVNLLTPERVRYAASLVRKGKVFNLEPSRSIPHPARSKDEPYHHEITVRRTGRTDHVDHWELHGGMGHMDGLRHMRYREFGYYQGLQDEDLDRDVMLGIDRWGEHGMVGRGIFIDVPRHFEMRGQSLDPNARFPIGPELIEAIAEEQGVEFQPGDIMLLRTGWMRWYLSLTPEGRHVTHGTVHPGDDGLHCPGLDATQPTAAYLWDRQFSLLWADNIALEAMPIQGSEFQHRRIIPLMGMGIAELLTFEELSADCAEDGVYECMVSAKPAGVPGACGSPANAYAIK